MRDDNEKLLDIDIVWAVIEKDLPQLREMIKKVL